MTPEERQKFALSYYGWDDDPAPDSEALSDAEGYIFDRELIKKIEAELPFA
jgi:hypothetical protein